MSGGIDWQLIGWACVVVPLALFCAAIPVGGWITDRREAAAKRRGFNVLTETGKHPVVNEGKPTRHGERSRAGIVPIALVACSASARPSPRTPATSVQRAPECR